MDSPIDGHVVDSRQEEIVFSGAVNFYDKPVRILAFNRYTEMFEFVHSIQPSSTPTMIDGISLYRWIDTFVLPHSFWMPGGQGYRARVKSDSIYYSVDHDSQQCWEENPDIFDFFLNCTSGNSPEAIIKTRDYIPDVDFAKTDCDYGDNACSPCVPQVLTTISSIDIQNSDFGYRIKTGDAPTFTAMGPHIQGVVRLADIVRDGNRIGRMVLTHNLWDKGLNYAEQVVHGGVEAIFYGDRTLKTTYKIPIRENRNHPGGAQAHGNTVAIAMEGGLGIASAPQPHAAVYFFHFPPQDGLQGRLVNELVLDGSQGEPMQTDQNSASAAAFIQLNEGNFLTAVSGSKHGTKGIWFYVSSNTHINEKTEWDYVGFWEPPTCTTTRGKKLDECFGGASGMALITNCTGKIFLITMHGSDRNRLPPDEYEWIQVYQVEQQSDGTVDLEFLDHQRDNTGRVQINNPAFRWAGGVYVTQTGGVVFFNTERRTKENDNDYVDGHIYHSKEK